jgi:hypothetical protein
VVDFHKRLLRERRVSVWDSRPSAWQATSQAVDEARTSRELRSWLAVQFVGRDHVVVKDPRIGWFLPLWQRAADDLGIETSFATLLRHPAQAVSSAIKWYGDWQSPASRTTSWLNIMLETEQATRQSTRVFVRYDNLLDDWWGEIDRVGAVLDLAVLRDLDDTTRKEIDAFVDPGLHRSRVTWADLGVPAQVESMTESAWQQFVAVAEPGGESAESLAEFDVAREAYHRFYAEAEDIAQSSLHALRPGTDGAAVYAGTRSSGVVGTGAGSRGSGADVAIRLAERILPRSLLRRVPPVWRARVVRTANRAAGLVRR